MNHLIHASLRNATAIGLGSACLYALAGHHDCYADSPSPGPAPSAVVVAAAEAPYEPAPAEVIAVYKTDLAPAAGIWVQDAEYGWVWIPRARPADWYPYSVGHWVNTDCGWYWVAEGDEAEWGLITYHYGCWHRHLRLGWIWVPGTLWAPAWVSWRWGGGYCGWAPIPPRIGRLGICSAREIDRRVTADQYVYVEARWVGEPGVCSHRIRPDATVFNRTANITRITVVNGRAVNRGADVAEIERASNRKYGQAKFAEAASAAEAHRAREQGRPVFYNPPAVAKADAARRARVSPREAAPQEKGAQQPEHRPIQGKAAQPPAAAHERGSRNPAANNAEKAAPPAQPRAPEEAPKAKHDDDAKADKAGKVAGKDSGKGASKR